MSENIFVETDGVKHNYNGVKSILTKNMDGGTTKWIPNLETMLMTKHINKNGTYKASNDGAYAYDKVVVSTTGKATGKKQDGNTYVVQPDANGDLQETKVPVKIEITTNPSKLSYTDEEAIDLTGAVVKAYNGDGSLWTASGYSNGIIPNNELTVRPSRAEYKGGGGSDIYEKDGVKALAIRATVPVSGQYWSSYRSSSPIGYIENGAMGRHYQFLTTENSSTVIYLTKYNGRLYVATSNKPDGNGYVLAYEDGTGAYGWSPFTGGFDTNFIFVIGFGTGESFTIPIPTSDVDPEGFDFSGAEDSTGQTITVAWNRPEDEEELTDTFNITVAPLR